MTIGNWYTWLSYGGLSAARYKSVSLPQRKTVVDAGVCALIQSAVLSVTACTFAEAEVVMPTRPIIVKVDT